MRLVRPHLLLLPFLALAALAWSADEVKMERFPNGAPKLESSYRDGIRHGKATEWSPSGKIKLEQFWEKGQLVRTVEYDNGLKSHDVGWDAEGRKHGLEIYWRADGKKYKEGASEHARPSGWEKYYDADGNLSYELKEEFSHVPTAYRCYGPKGEKEEGPIANLATVEDKKEVEKQGPELKLIGRYSLPDCIQKKISANQARATNAPPNELSEIDKLREQLRSSESYIRQDAAEKLMRQGEKARDAVPELLAALENSDSRGVGTFIRALHVIGVRDNSAIPSLVRLLESTDVNRRSDFPTVARVLANIRTPEAKKAFLDWYRPRIPAMARYWTPTVLLKRSIRQCAPCPQEGDLGVAEALVESGLPLDQREEASDTMEASPPICQHVMFDWQHDQRRDVILEILKKGKTGCLSPRQIYELAVKTFNDKNYLRAARLFEVAEEFDPKNPFPPYKLAITRSVLITTLKNPYCEQKIGLDSIIAPLTRAMGLDPSMKDRILQNPDFRPIQSSIYFQTLAGKADRDSDHGIRDLLTHHTWKSDNECGIDASSIRSYLAFREKDVEVYLCPSLGSPPTFEAPFNLRDGVVSFKHPQTQEDYQLKFHWDGQIAWLEHLNDHLLDFKDTTTRREGYRKWYERKEYCPTR